MGSDKDVSQASDLFGPLLSRLGGSERTKTVGAAGGGAVKVTMLGMHQVERVEISPEAVDDVGLLEELLAAAFNEALLRARDQTQQAALGLLQQLSKE